MRPDEILASFPDRIEAGLRAEAAYFKTAGCAVHGRPAGAPAPQALFTLNDGEIAVFGQPAPPVELERDGIELTAVYVRGSAGPRAVPTGRVFVRFREGVHVEAQQALIAAAGFVIVESLSYAPHAAWLRALSQEPADALRQFPRLAEISAVDNAEPQMLMERGHR